MILVDRGMIEDHMPNRVMDILRAYHKQISVETSLVFTRGRVAQERHAKMTDTIRNMIEQRVVQVMRVSSDCCEDEPDGAAEEVDGDECSDEVVESVERSDNVSITMESDPLGGDMIELEQLGSDNEDDDCMKSESVSSNKNTVLVVGT